MDNPWTMEIEIGQYSKGACRAKGPRTSREWMRRYKTADLQGVLALRLSHLS